MIIPFELLSEIISFIGSGVEDLVTISRLCLACRACVPFCQQRIFEKIKIEPYVQPFIHRKAAKLTRLRDAFQTSPHLSTYVRALNFNIQYSDIQKPDVAIEIFDSLVDIAHLRLSGCVAFSAHSSPEKVAASLITLLGRATLKFVEIDFVYPWLLSRLSSSVEKLWITDMVFDRESSVTPLGIKELLVTIPVVKPPRPKELLLKEATMDYLLGFSDTGSQPFVDVQNLTSLSFTGTGSQNKIRYISEKAENLTTLTWTTNDHPVDFDGLGDLFKASSRHTLEDLHIHFLTTPYASVQFQDMARGVAQIAEELRAVPKSKDCGLSIVSISIVIDMSVARHLGGTFLCLDQVLTKGRFPQLKEVSISIEIEWDRDDFNTSEEELCALEEETHQLCDEQFQNVQELEDVYFDCEVRMVESI